MVTAKSLRIGNWLNYKWADLENGGYMDEPIQISANEIKELSFTPKNRYYTPIPITSEILTACGFEKCSLTIDINDNWHIGAYNGVIYLQFEESSKYSEGTIASINFPEIKYLHQLQNLYFSLTNIELTFKH